MILSLINILIAAVILLFMDHYKHRGVKRIGLAVGIASACMLIAGISILLGKPYARLYIEPDYLYLFVAAYIRFMTKVFICLAVGSTIAAVLIRLLSRGMRKALYEG